MRAMVLIGRRAYTIHVSGKNHLNSINATNVSGKKTPEFNKRRTPEAEQNGT